MANFIAIADGNLTTGSTWVTTSGATNANLVSTSTSNNALTTGNLDSATFVPAGSAIQYIAVRLALRAAGSPTNTLTVHLRNSTTSTDVLSWTLNVSDLPECNTTDDAGGWVLLYASSSHTPNGTDSYLIRMTLSATTTAVNFYTNGTNYNWQRLIGLTTTGAPGAGDDMYIAGWYDNTSNPCTTATRSITMDQTAATDYGSNNTNSRVAGMSISKGGTLAFPTAANSLLQLSGACVIFSGGTLSIGTTGTPVGATYTATLQFDCGSNEAFGLFAKKGSTVSAVWAGYTKSWTLLTADAAISATSLSVADSTGWKDGDSIVIATTDQTSSHSESRTLNGDAGASSITITAGLTYAHDGDTTNKYQAEIINLTRGVTIKALNTSYRTYCIVKGTGTFRWVRFDVIGGATNKGVNVSQNNDFELTNCAFTNDNSTAIYFPDYGEYTNTISIQNNVFYETIAGASAQLIANYTVGFRGTITISYNVCITTSNISTYVLDLNDGAITFNYNRCIGNASSSYSTIRLTSNYHGFSPTGNIIHSGANGLSLEGDFSYDLTVEDTHIWRMTTTGLLILGGQIKSYVFNNLKITGCDRCIWMQGTVDNIQFNDSYFVGDTTYATDEVLYYYADSLAITNIVFNNCYNDLTSGIWVPTNYALFGLASFYSLYQIVWRGSPIKNNYSSQSNLSPSSYFRSSTTTGGHKTICKSGMIEKDTSTVGGKTNLIKMTPQSSTVKLSTDAGNLFSTLNIPVALAATPAISIYVRKTTGYNGNAPRLILRSNPSMGVDIDTVLDTLSVGVDTWEALTYTLPAAPIKGMYQIAVDCDGTAGNVYVAELTIDGNAISLEYWQDGLPIVPSSLSSTTAAEVSVPFLGFIK